MNSFTSTEGAGVAGPDISRVTSGFPRRSKFSTEYVISSATGELVQRQRSDQRSDFGLDNNTHKTTKHAESEVDFSPI